MGRHAATLIAGCPIIAAGVAGGTAARSCTCNMHSRQYAAGHCSRVTATLPQEQLAARAARYGTNTTRPPKEVTFLQLVVEALKVNESHLSLSCASW